MTVFADVAGVEAAGDAAICDDEGVDASVEDGVAALLELEDPDPPDDEPADMDPGTASVNLVVEPPQKVIRRLTLSA